MLITVGWLLLLRALESGGRGRRLDERFFIYLLAENEMEDGSGSG